MRSEHCTLETDGPDCCRNYQRDGPMTVTNNQAGAPNYFPNSFSGPRSDRKYQEHRTNLSADITRWNSADEDNFTQVGCPGTGPGGLTEIVVCDLVSVVGRFTVLDLD